MIHARADYNRIQDPGLDDPGLIPNGCTPFASDEPVFLLRAQDITAPAVVREWADLNEKLGGDPNAIQLARNHADLMESWGHRKLADV